MSATMVVVRTTRGEEQILTGGSYLLAVLASRVAPEDRRSVEVAGDLLDEPTLRRIADLVAASEPPPPAWLADVDLAGASRDAPAGARS